MPAAAARGRSHGCHRGVLALLVVAVVGVSGAGHAAPDPKTVAKRLVLEGAQLVKRGDYDTALLRFKAAYDLVPSPKIQYDLGIAYMGLERNAEAFEAFQTFLSDASEATTETITKARLYKESLLLKVCRLTVHSDVQGATITLDGRPHGTTPPPGEILLDAGNHSLVVAKDGVGTPFTKWFDASAGSTLTIDANLLPPPLPRRPARRSRSAIRRPGKDSDLAVRRSVASDRRGAGPGWRDSPPAAWRSRRFGFGTVEWVIKELRFREFNSRHCDKAPAELRRRRVRLAQSTRAPRRRPSAMSALLRRGSSARPRPSCSWSDATIPPRGGEESRRSLARPA